MNLLKALFCVGLWTVLGCGPALAQDSYEYSVTTIPYAQDFVEESIETIPFTEEETDNTTVDIGTQEMPKVASQTGLPPQKTQKPVIDEPSSANGQVATKSRTVQPEPESPNP